MLAGLRFVFVGAEDDPEELRRGIVKHGGAVSEAQPRANSSLGHDEIGILLGNLSSRDERTIVEMIGKPLVYSDFLTSCIAHGKLRQPHAAELRFPKGWKGPLNILPGLPSDLPLTSPSSSSNSSSSNSNSNSNGNRLTSPDMQSQQQVPLGVLLREAAERSKRARRERGGAKDPAAAEKAVADSDFDDSETDHGRRAAKVLKSTNEPLQPAAPAPPRTSRWDVRPSGAPSPSSSTTSPAAAPLPPPRPTSHIEGWGGSATQHAANSYAASASALLPSETGTLQSPSQQSSAAKRRGHGGGGAGAVAAGAAGGGGGAASVSFEAADSLAVDEERLSAPAGMLGAWGHGQGSGKQQAGAGDGAQPARGPLASPNRGGGTLSVGGAGPLAKAQALSPAAAGARGRAVDGGLKDMMDFFAAGSSEPLVEDEETPVAKGAGDRGEEEEKKGEGHPGVPSRPPLPPRFWASIRVMADHPGLKDGALLKRLETHKDKGEPFVLLMRMPVLDAVTGAAAREPREGGGGHHGGTH